MRPFTGVTKLTKITTTGMAVVFLGIATLFSGVAQASPPYMTMWNGTQTHAPGHYELLESGGGQPTLELTFQSNGNLVLYSNGKVLWQTYTAGEVYGSGYLALQSDGNIVIYNVATSGYYGSTFIAKKALWATGTNMANYCTSGDPFWLYLDNQPLTNDNGKEGWQRLTETLSKCSPTTHKYLNVQDITHTLVK